MNLFKDIIGQKRITKTLSNAVINNKLHHAYLFTGQPGVGKEAVAFELIKIINCTGEKNGYCGKCRSCRELNAFSCDDLLYIFPDIIKRSDTEKIVREKNQMILDELKEKSRLKGYYKFGFKKGRFITINQIGGIKDFSKFNSINKSKKIVLIDNAHLMNKEAQNSLLKILEEPPADLFFILITENPSFLLVTIRSRCLEIAFPQLGDDDLREYISRHFPHHDEGVTARAVSDSFGSIDNLKTFLSGQVSVTDTIKDRFVELFTVSKPPETVRIIDSILVSIKELSDDEINLILKRTLLGLLDHTFGDENKNSLEARKNIMNDFERFGYMYRRNINPRLLLINLYLNYREEHKKWTKK